MFVDVKSYVWDFYEISFQIEVMEQHALKNVNNGRESAINRGLDGSTYPGEKLVPSSLFKEIRC